MAHTARVFALRRQPLLSGDGPARNYGRLEIPGGVSAVAPTEERKRRVAQRSPANAQVVIEGGSSVGPVLRHYEFAYRQGVVEAKRAGRGPMALLVERSPAGGSAGRRRPSPRPLFILRFPTRKG